MPRLRDPQKLTKCLENKEVFENNGMVHWRKYKKTFFEGKKIINTLILYIKN